MALARKLMLVSALTAGYGLGTYDDGNGIDDGADVLTYLQTLQVALEGPRSTTDLEPADRRLIVVSDSGQNLLGDGSAGFIRVDAPLKERAGVLPN
jgi:hypothetical protein